MAINWDFTNLKYGEFRDLFPWTMEDLGFFNPTGNLMANMIILLMLDTGIPHITDDNFDEFVKRVRVREAYMGCLLLDGDNNELPMEEDELRKGIGARINGFSETRKEFYARHRDIPDGVIELNEAPPARKTTPIDFYTNTDQSDNPN